jgi:hypothetical protein
MAAGYASRRTDGLAITALIFGIASIVCTVACLGIVLGPAAAIMGFIGRQRITSSGGAVGGGGLALAGIILGIVGFVLSVGWFFVAISGIITSSSLGTPTPS